MANEVLIDAYLKGDLQTVNTELVKIFNSFNRDLNKTVDYIYNIQEVQGVRGRKPLTRGCIIGKLSYMGEKNIVPAKPAKPKKDTGPTKKDILLDIVDALQCSINDIDTFNNVKKSQLTFLLNEVNTLKADIEG